MSKFIKVTRNSGNEIDVNLDNVTYIEYQDKQSIIYFSKDDKLFIKDNSVDIQGLVYVDD